MSAELFEAIASQDIDRLQKALKQGADPSAVQPDYPGFTALQAVIDAIDEGAASQMLDLLLAHGAVVDGWDASDDATPLLMAVFRNQKRTVTLLLNAGADVNVRGAEGDSPLRWCVERNDVVMAAELLRAGASQSIDDPGGELGMTALGLACTALNLAMVELLLYHGAKPNTLDAHLKTPLEYLATLETAPKETLDKIVAQLRAVAPLGTRTAENDKR